MRQNEIERDVTIYNALIWGAAHAQWHKGCALFTDEVLDLMEADQIAANAETFEMLIRACAAVGDVVNGNFIYTDFIR